MLEFKEETHEYLYDGVVIPSVTTIIKVLSSYVYKGIDEEVLKKAADKGTAVHKAIEDVEKWGEYNIEPLWQGFVDNYLQAKQELKFEVLHSEMQLTNGIYAGTIDCIALYNGKTILIDFKTTTTIHNKLVQPQLSAYQNLANSNGYVIDELYILQLTKKGYKFQKVEYDISWFNKCLEIFNYMNGE